MSGHNPDSEQCDATYYFIRNPDDLHGGLDLLKLQQAKGRAFPGATAHFASPGNERLERTAADSDVRRGEHEHVASARGL